ncbi:zinc finger, CCHC-type containing protein [Tanacetum coccineum]
MWYGEYLFLWIPLQIWATNFKYSALLNIPSIHVRHQQRQFSKRNYIRSVVGFSLGVRNGFQRDTVKDMTVKFRKLYRFEGNDFRRWQKKMYFLLTTLKVVYVLSTPVPEFVEDGTLEQTRKRCKRDNENYICHGHILNGMSDALSNVYQNVGLAKMVDSSIIDKLPPSWKDFKHTLKHIKDGLSLVQLGIHFRIKETLRAEESGKGKGKEIAGSYLVNMIEDGKNKNNNKNNNAKKRKNDEEDPRTFDEVMQSRDVAFWKEAINDEMDSIMENNTWILSDLPSGFRQKEGINYFDTYAHVARISTIRLLIALATTYNLVIHLMDVKTTFLNGDLEEEVYMKHPEGFIMHGNEHKDVGEVDMILGIRIKREDKGITITQSHYIEKRLKKFKCDDCYPVSTPLDPTIKLMPNTGRAVDQLEYSRAIGCLMYAMTSTRPDIAYAVGKLSRVLKGGDRGACKLLGDMVVISWSQWVLKSVSPEQLITVANVIDAAKVLIIIQMRLRYISSADLQIHKRVGAHKSKYHDAKTISLGLGDTAQRGDVGIPRSSRLGMEEEDMITNYFTTIGTDIKEMDKNKDKTEHGIGKSARSRFQRCLRILLGQPQKKEEEKRIAKEQAARDRYWKIPICYDDDEDYTIATTPVLSTKEPVDSLIMEDDEVRGISEAIRVNVPVYEDPSTFDALNDHSKILSDSNNDSTSNDDDSYENIDYVDASPPDAEIVSLEVVEIVVPEVGGIDTDILLTIKDDILHEKLLNVNLFIAKIEALKDNPVPSSDFVIKSPHLS